MKYKKYHIVGTVPKYKKYHIVGTVPKSIRKIVERSKIDNPTCPLCT
jgi:flavin-binding protein dodecin